MRQMKLLWDLVAEEMGRLVEVATSQHQLHLVLEAWIQRHHHSSHLLQVMTEHHRLHRLVQQPLLLLLRRMAQLLIKLASTQAGFAIFNHQACK
jgi:hypothetical protein